MSTRFAKIHGMRDDKWTTKDKLQQYRGILKLHARDKKLQTAVASKLKKKVFRNLKSLSTDVEEYRGIINDIHTGDKRRLYPLFLEHKDLLLALINLPSTEMLNGVFQDSSLKQKQLDKLFFQKKQKMKEFFDLKLECTILSSKLDQKEVDPSDRVQQSLITRYQRSMARHNAAQSIRATYELMLNILKKDAFYFDTILEALRKDQNEQCKVIFKVTVMGQLVAENLDDNFQKYKRLARDVWTNMRERERTLKIARAQVEDIWAFAQSLVRVQSDTDITEKIKETPRIDGELESHIQILEQFFLKVKESLCIRSFEELQLRLEEQSAHNKKLSQQFNLTLKERDFYLKKKQHAELILATLEHTMVSTTGEYKLNKKEMLEEMVMKKKRQKDCKETRKIRGQLLMNIRAALQNMADMLIMVDEKTMKKPVKSGGGGGGGGGGGEITEEIEDTGNEKPELELQKVETDALALLVQVTRKVTFLYTISNFDLDKEKEERARDLYQTYVADYKSNSKFSQEEPEPTGIYVEHEMIDSNILTRKDIKKISKQIVQVHLKEE